MARQLPALLHNEPDSHALATPAQRQGIVSSPIARLAVALAPEVLRAAERVVLRRTERRAVPASIQDQPARSIQVSEVEINFDMPFVRRVVVRNASAWSSFPTEPAPSRSGLRRAGRVIGMSGALALVAGVAVRRLGPAGRGRIIDIQSRRRD